LPDAIKKSDTLFSTRWVHVFEEDTPEGAVYRPDSADLPLSRRPREQLELKADGSASVTMAGPDDRPAPIHAHWQEEGGEVSIRTTGPAARELRIVSHSADRLIVRR
jgi:hypothetical protein